MPLGQQLIGTIEERITLEVAAALMVDGGRLIDALQLRRGQTGTARDARRVGAQGSAHGSSPSITFAVKPLSVIVIGPGAWNLWPIHNSCRG